ncbi:unnamed protein product [Phaedon cochleariae]|uniref:CHK kinase-like domain-containing protein n=1 Tax=Phaedon cochleariae TaxID=80249 RepID=A0A9P0DR67_PHACE|nr:unnamed protein product [Phaedon cochleariae]
MLTLPRDISDVLETSLGTKITDYHISLGECNSKGLGFVSELLFVDLIHKSTGEQHHLAIKQALPSGGAYSMRMMRNAFANEIRFYQTCWPTLKRFQGSHPRVKPFRCLAKCYGAAKEVEKEKLVLENLKARGFTMYERSKAFDLRHMEVLFKTLAEFHAISFAYRHKKSEDAFEELTKPMVNIWLFIMEALFFPEMIKECLKGFLEKVRPELREKVGRKLERYFDGLEAVINECSEYTGSCPVLLHRDCWSNNNMFKYNESQQISEIKFLDFQVAGRGSPVQDLSYCFYSGASTEVLQNFENLLRIYHDTLSTALEAYGCAVDEIYPMRTLKDEWTKYSKYGLLQSILIRKAKLTDSKDAHDLNKLLDNDLAEMNKPANIDMEEFTRITSELIMHAAGGIRLRSRRSIPHAHPERRMDQVLQVWIVTGHPDSKD